MMDFRKHAAQIAEYYKTNDKIASIMIAGSVSRGWNDAFSDIEVYVLWKDAPTDEDRLSPIEKVGGKVIDFYPLEDNEWSETYMAGGVKFEMSHFLVSYLEEMIMSVISQNDTDKDKQCLMAGIQDGVILHGEELAQGLKDKVASYPDSLGKEVVIEHLELSSRWNSRYVLSTREDLFILYDVLNEVIGKVLGILHGVNRMYIGHPRMKWLKQTVGQMHRAPENLTERLRNIYKERNQESIKDLEKILLETYDLVEEVYPDLDMDELKKKLLVTRPTQA